MRLVFAKAASSSARSSSSRAKAKSLQIVRTMLALAQPGADDDRGDRRLFQHPASRDIGDGDLVLARDRVGGGEDGLQRLPSRRWRR